MKWKSEIYGVVYILIPYIIWLLIYEVEMWYYDDRALVLLDIVNRLLLGQSKYQLYFIFIVVQFYFIFPLLMIMVRKWGFLRKYLWLFGIVIEFAFFKFNQSTSYVDVPSLFTKMGPYLLGACSSSISPSIWLRSLVRNPFTGCEASPIIHLAIICCIHWCYFKL